MRHFFTNKFIFLAVILTLFARFANGADTIINTDTTKVGRKVSSGDKKLEFDTNSGANNPAILTTPANNDLRLKTNKVKLGTGAAADQELQFNTGVGTPPAIKWNNTTAKLEFTNDGTNFKGIGSGSGGGGSGLNLIENNGFEDGTLGFTNSGGAVAVVTTGSNLLAGLKSVTFDASAGSQYFESNAITIPEYLKGRNCLARVHYKGGDANLKFKILNSSNVAIADEKVFSTQTTVTQMQQSFICPTSGSMKFRIESTADAALIALDQVHIGENDMLVQVSQAVHVGTLKYPQTANCEWNNTTASFAGFSADTDCGTPIVSGGLTAPSTKIPAFKMNVVAGSTYRINVNFFAFSATTSTSIFILSDGTDSTDMFANSHAGGGGFDMVATGGSAIYKPTTSGLKTIEIQARSISGGVSGIRNYETGPGYGTDLIFEVEQFPSQSQLAVNSVNSNSGLVAWTPTFTGVTASNIDMKWSRRGDKMYIVGKFDHTGGTAITMTLPNGLTVDSSKISSTNYHTVGTGSISSAHYTLTVLAQGGLQTLSFGLIGVATGGNNPFSSWSSETMQFSAEFPITGWNESQLNMPVLVGGVSTGSSGAMRIESAKISSTCVLSNTSSSWVVLSSGSNISTGCSYTISGFSGAPNCSFAGELADNCPTYFSGFPTSTVLGVQSSSCSNGTSSASGATIICMGPK